jgi:hypothetical protein
LVGSTVAVFLIGTAAAKSTSLNPAVGTIFAACLLASVGISNVFATIDETPTAGGALLGKAAKPIVVLVLVVVSGIGLLGVVRLLSRTSATTAASKLADIELTGTADRREVGVTALPASVRIRLAAPATVKLQLGELNSSALDVAIGVVADSNAAQRLYVDDPDPPVIESKLPAGDYTVYKGHVSWVAEAVKKNQNVAPQQAQQPTAEQPAPGQRTLPITFVARDLSNVVLHSTRRTPYTLHVTVTK